MRIIDDGHKYLLQDNKKSTETTKLTFFKDAEINGDGYDGTTNQEVLRALIDRIDFLEEQVSSPYNEKIRFHLRQALVLHEARHLERLVEKGQPIERLEVQDSGHLVREL